MFVNYQLSRVRAMVRVNVIVYPEKEFLLGICNHAKFVFVFFQKWRKKIVSYIEISFSHVYKN